MTEICDFCGGIFLNLPVKAYPPGERKKKKKRTKRIIKKKST